MKAKMNKRRSPKINQQPQAYQPLVIVEKSEVVKQFAEVADAVKAFAEQAAEDKKYVCDRLVHMLNLWERHADQLDRIEKRIKAIAKAVKR